MARATTLTLATLLLLATAASASRNLQQTSSASANPPNSAFGGPKVPIDASITPPAGNTVKINWRAVGTQNYTSASNSQYVAGGAVANFFLQNGTNIVGKHFFTSNNGVLSPVFTRTDASGNTIGTVVGRAVANVSAPATNDDGGFGSIPFVLLQAVSADGFFAGVTYVQRINTLGGVVPGNPKLFTLPASPTGVANFPLAVPYQADYLFFTGGSPASG